MIRDQFLLILNNRLFGGEVNTEAVAKLASQLDSKLDGYERLLGRQRYLAGNVSESVFLLSISTLRPMMSDYSRILPWQIWRIFPQDLS